MEQQSLEKSEAQVPMQYSKINDKPFPPSTDYVFSKSKNGDQLRSCQTQYFKKFPWLHYDEKYFSRFLFFTFILFYFFIS